MIADGLPKLAIFDGLGYDELAEFYAYPDTTRWVRGNFVASIDGAVTVGGKVGSLTTATDQRILTLLRDLADAVLVGAATVRVEGYTGIRTSDDLQRWRRSRDLAPIARVAVVSGRANLDPRSGLLVDTAVAPIIYTSTDASTESKKALTSAGADVIEIGSANLGISAILDDLKARGMTRILCEGGPTLLGELIADNALDELCLTTTPALVGGNAGRVATSAKVTDIAMRCQHILIDQDGSQFARWVRRSTPTMPS